MDNGHNAKAWLVDYYTAERIRPATAEEIVESVAAADRDGGAGAIEVDGRTCYVEGAARCECGTWSGARCAWIGPEDAGVIVEFVPESIRASHEAARNRGRYPANGSVRLLVEPSCAQNILADAGDWAAVLG